jgi:hypothetical protein
MGLQPDDVSQEAFCDNVFAAEVGGIWGHLLDWSVTSTCVCVWVGVGAGVGMGVRACVYLRSRVRARGLGAVGVLSWLSNDIINNPPQQPTSLSPPPLPQRSVNDARFAHRSHPNVLLLCYETLVNDHEESVRLIARFCGVEADETLIARVVEQST